MLQIPDKRSLMTCIDLVASPWESFGSFAVGSTFCCVLCLFQSMTGSFTKGSRTDSNVSRFSRNTSKLHSIPLLNIPSAPVGPKASSIFGVRRKGTTSGRGKFNPLSNILNYQSSSDSRAHNETEGLRWYVSEF